MASVLSANPRRFRQYRDKFSRIIFRLRLASVIGLGVASLVQGFDRLLQRYQRAKDYMAHRHKLR